MASQNNPTNQQEWLIWSAMRRRRKHRRSPAATRHLARGLDRGGSGGAAGRIRPERGRRRNDDRVAAPALGRRPQPAGDSADRSGRARSSLLPRQAGRPRCFEFYGGMVMLVMVVLGVSLRFVQETKADNAAAKLKAMIKVTATVVRDGQQKEIPLHQLVPGDVVKLSAGDMIPGDVRLHCGQGFVHHPGHADRRIAAGGKNRRPRCPRQVSSIEHTNICFLGTSVESGAATGGHRGHGRADLFRQDGQQPCRPAGRHGL